jgi:hypothetical protein
MAGAGDDGGLEALAARWRGSAAAADLAALAERIPAGTDRARLRALLGEPLLVSPLADGGEAWLYVRSDAGRGQRESLSILLSPDGGFLELARKPID